MVNSIQVSRLGMINVMNRMKTKEKTHRHLLTCLLVLRDPKLTWWYYDHFYLSNEAPCPPVLPKKSNRESLKGIVERTKPALKRSATIFTAFLKTYLINQ